MTGLVFDVNFNPLTFSVKNSYNPRLANEKNKTIVKSAKFFLESLNHSQKKNLIYPFSDNKQRANWSNFPEGMVERGGLKLKSLSQKQRANLDKLITKIMSKKGVEIIKQQMVAEDTIPQNFINKYGTKYFYVAFLGLPSENYPWMFQFGGHHLGINVTIYGDDILFSPMLTGAQPAHIKYEGKNIFITQDEFLACRVFINSLNQEQKKIAIRSNEIIALQYGPGKYGKSFSPEGIKGSELTAKQKQLLIKLIDTRINLINEYRYKKIKNTVLNELNDTYFG